MLNDIFLILGALENLFFGTDASDCPLPCETFSTETKLTSATSSDYAGFGLTFKDTVEVHKQIDDRNSASSSNHLRMLFIQVSTTKMMRPTFFSFLSEVSLCTIYFLRQQGPTILQVHLSGWHVYNYFLDLEIPLLFTERCIIAKEQKLFSCR